MGELAEGFQVTFSDHFLTGLRVNNTHTYNLHTTYNKNICYQTLLVVSISKEICKEKSLKF